MGMAAQPGGAPLHRLQQVPLVVRHEELLAWAALPLPRQTEPSSIMGTACTVVLGFGFQVDDFTPGSF